MRIKTRLSIGIGFLFANIILLAALSTKEINELSDDTKNILVTNYNTLDYTRNMMIALDGITTDSMSVKMFTDNLIRQKANITEKGEKEMTDQLIMHFQKLMGNTSDVRLHEEVRKDLYEIMRLNMQAIERKSRIAEETADKATTWIATAGILCFLFAFILFVNLPGSIANPIHKLTNSIKQIAAQKYNERVHFDSKSEFGELAEAFNTMAAKLEEYDSSNLAKLLIEKKRIETLINKLHHPVIGIDDKMMVLFANGEALNILGLKAEQIIGRSAQEISITNDLMRSLLKDLIHKSEERQEYSPSLKIYANNKESYFEKEIIPISIIPTGEKQSKDIGYVIILQNITSFKELDSAKTNFIATISHELKTPISSIKMSLQLLNDARIGKLNEEQHKLLTGITEDSDRLLKITGELLNLSQVDTGNIQLNIQQSDPKQIVHYALEAVKVQAEQKQVHLDAKLDDHLPHVKADSEKTAWVLINLLTNAIRYSPGNADVMVEVKNDKQEVMFSVKDFGKGIDNRYTSRVFDRYFQVPGSSKAGTGLGLAISKEFIEAQEGEIGVESSLGEGSKFYFKLKAV